MPDRSFTFAVEHEDRFFKHKPHRLGARARRQLKDVRPVSCLCAFEIEQSRIGAESRPWPYFDSSYVRNVIALVNRHALTRHPLFVRSPLAERLGAKSFDGLCCGAARSFFGNRYRVQNRLGSHHSESHSQHAGGEIAARDFAINQFGK